MDSKIIFTPEQLVSALLAICAAVISISAAINAAAQWVNKLSKPEKRQNERITACEEELEKHSEFIQSSDERLESIETALKVNQKSMLALLKHAINGNDIDQLKKAERDLEEYLVEKI